MFANKYPVCLYSVETILKKWTKQSPILWFCFIPINSIRSHVNAKWAIKLRIRRLAELKVGSQTEVQPPL